ncbi:peptidylprolyl isomerase [Pseudomonas endophytica]|uniref:Peptidyl-prolyl cis-trans isomerase n=1 Tax=Pseudomonas endophytica TaxID=1563157 RepID=A0A0Q0X7H2_9PSED|nr:FKBP-type peptidyl-prolyl cis-trans isomerase [Pseudomonas endophytica]KQB52998.1 peptidylprolyl isomerase [Pseudomonas endophytica]
MPRSFLLTLLCIACATHAAPPQSPQAAQDLAYSLGASLGERLREEVPELQLQALIDGLRTAYEGKPLVLSDERIKSILAAHQAQIETEQAQPQSEIVLTAEHEFLLKEKHKIGVRELGNGILMTELRPGSGVKPEAQGSVSVNYVGRLPDGTIFDQSSQPQWFRLDSVITGWRLALTQMPAGSKWRLVIPSSQAYGAEGAGDLIAPYTPLVFEIELLNAR